MEAKTKRILLVILLLLGIVITFYFVSHGNEIINNKGWFKQYHLHSLAEVWELAALVWSFLFGVYYTILFFTSEPITNRYINFFVPWMGPFFTFIVPGIAIYCLFNNYTLKHLFFVASLSLIYLVLDWLISIHHQNVDVKKEFKTSHWLANVPVIITYLILFFWILANRNTDGLINFSSGIIAALFFSSNIIFILAQWGVIKEIYDLDRADVCKVKGCKERKLP